MTNEDKYGVSKGMGVFMVYAKAHGIELSMQSFADWMNQEEEEEKPMPCPYCGGRVELDYIRVNLHEQDFRLMCTKDDCLYSSGLGEDKAEAIAAHNRICKAVAAYKESEVTNA